METQEFEEISKKKYKLSTPIAFIMSFSFLIFLYSFMIINIFIYINPPLYTMNNMMIIVIMLPFLIYLFILVFFRRKNALNHHIQYYKNKDIEDKSKSGTETFCRGCGIIILTEIFKKTDEKLIKPASIFVKGYFCKKCYKKFHRFSGILMLLLLTTFCIYFLPIYLLYIDKLTIYELFYTPFFMLYFIILTVFARSRRIRYLKRYN